MSEITARSARRLSAAADLLLRENDRTCGAIGMKTQSLPVSEIHDLAGEKTGARS